MHSTSSPPRRGPPRPRTGGRRPGRSRALLAVLACLVVAGGLAGLGLAELHRSPGPVIALSPPGAGPPGTAGPGPPAAGPSGTSPPAARPAPAGRSRLGAISWPAAGVAAAAISGYGVTGGP